MKICKLGSFQAANKQNLQSKLYKTVLKSTHTTKTKWNALGRQKILG